MPPSNSVFLHLRGMNALLRGQPLVFEDVSITKTNVVDTVRPLLLEVVEYHISLMPQFNPTVQKITGVL